MDMQTFRKSPEIYSKTEKMPKKQKGIWVYPLQFLDKIAGTLKGDTVHRASDRLYIKDAKGQLWRAQTMDGKTAYRMRPRARRMKRWLKRRGYSPEV